MTTITMQRNIGATRPDAASHRFCVGDIVRLKGGRGMAYHTADTYRVTGKLPPREDSLQYRIRNDAEQHERVTTEDRLEPVRTSSTSETTLIERTFGHGQGTETQQS
ncbi:hypothetical protein [Arvimicrobium flavum]|uniref:hypothetical protein n=1 Tax=Arvimicrobium flavum TaxID=3393320 RepID=UPI00237AD69A|nr:hypothetical protein [Mesorhizobium shangrilense]